MRGGGDQGGRREKVRVEEQDKGRERREVDIWRWKTGGEEYGKKGQKECILKERRGILYKTRGFPSSSVRSSVTLRGPPPGL